MKYDKNVPCVSCLLLRIFVNKISFLPLSLHSLPIASAEPRRRHRHSRRRRRTVVGRCQGIGVGRYLGLSCCCPRYYDYGGRRC